jgi:hypothetical protein
MKSGNEVDRKFYGLARRNFFPVDGEIQKKIRKIYACSLQRTSTCEWHGMMEIKLIVWNRLAFYAGWMRRLES